MPKIVSPVTYVENARLANTTYQYANLHQQTPQEQIGRRILFDSGSQRSYISDKVRHALQLKAIRVEKVVIKTFGQVENSEVKELDVVQLKIKNKGDARFTFVESLRLPTICSPLTNQPLSSAHELPEFAGLKFADFAHKPPVTWFVF